MSWIKMGIALYLTYYTFIYALMIWKEGNKGAGVFIFCMAVCFVPFAWFGISGLGTSK